MNILLLAPHPFYQERGTPIAVNLLVRALVRNEHRIDLLTYHEGESPAYEGRVAIHRIAPPRGAADIRPGFSLRKLQCDAAMWPCAMRMARTGRYDLVYAVEESVFMAMRIKRRYGLPYVFDMDSSMPAQIVDKLPWARPLLPLMRMLERRAIRGAAAVVPMCDALADLAREAGARHITVLRDVALVSAVELPTLGWRATLGCRGTVLLYLGNLEPYQGIALLLHAFAHAAAELPDAVLIVAGGRPDDLARYRDLSRALGLADRVHFMGAQPLGAMGAVFAEADILVSPRIAGNNTPMKIYSYLAAGKPTLATSLPTHTQVLNTHNAMLCEPSPEALAEGMIALARDRERGAALAEQAAHDARTRYSQAAFEQTVAELCAYLDPVRPQARPTGATSD
jgi:glycosyltransferase involved in cell wall biosynthesis